MKSYTLALISLLVVGFPVGLYGYGYVKTSEALNRSLETVDISDLRVVAISLFPPSLEIKITLTIENPTDTSITLQSAYFEILFEEFKLGEIIAVNRPLPSKGRITLDNTMRVEANTIISAVRSYIERGNITLRVTGRAMASATYLFITVNREGQVDVERTYQRPR